MDNKFKNSKFSGDFSSESQKIKANSSAVYLGNNTAICRTVFGNKIYVDTRDISLSPHLLLDGMWEAWISEAMTRVIRPTMNCVDLGTNFGWYSVLMASRIGPDGFLIGADANPRMVELCRKSMAVNGFYENSKIHHIAVSDQKGVMEFNTLQSYMGSGSLSDMGDTATQYSDTIIKHTVASNTLDALVDGRSIDFMKIDCEGAEPSIVRGGENTLKNPKLQIFMEYAPAFYKSGEAIEMIDSLERLGFKFHSISTNSKFEKVSRDFLLNISGWSELYLTKL